MIKKILQFIKKQKLCNRLAAKDCLFLVENLKTFKHHINVAKLFFKPNKLSNQDKIKDFLFSENSAILSAFAQDFSARTDVFGDKLFVFRDIQEQTIKGDFLIRSITEPKDTEFYLDIFLELVKNDYPALWTQYLFFKKRLDMLLDMRIYGSELESLCDRVSNIEHGCDFSINWHKTSKDNLYIDFIDECRLSNNLSPLEQENFAQFFAYGLFEKSIFISEWNYLAINHFNQVFFLDFDYIYSANESLKKYAQKYITNHVEPSTLEELKLHRAFMLLEKYCHQIDIYKDFKPYLEQTFKSPNIPDRTSFLLKFLAEQDMAIGLSDTESSLNPAEFAYLVKPQNKLEQKKHRRKSLFYLFGLLILILVLLHLN